jgi:hypothetical protein
VTSVSYNGVAITPIGDMTNWMVVKTFLFVESGPGGGVLTITGTEITQCAANGTASGCKQSGLLLTCRGGNIWDG